MDEDEETEYGEFVCSLDKWLPIDVQKKRAKKLDETTNKSTDK